MLYGAHILGLSELSLDKSWCFLFIYKVGTFSTYTQRLANQIRDWIQWGHKKSDAFTLGCFRVTFFSLLFVPHSLNALFPISWEENQCNKIELPIQRQSDSSAIFTNSIKKRAICCTSSFHPFDVSLIHARKMLKNHLITRSISSMHPAISVYIFGLFSPCSKSFRSLVK